MCGQDYKLHEKLRIKREYHQAMRQFFTKKERRIIDKFAYLKGTYGALLNTNRGWFEIDIYKGKLTIYDLAGIHKRKVRLSSQKIDKKTLFRLLSRARKKEVKCIVIDE